MSHCVASYVSNCRRGNKSVRSMQAADAQGRSGLVVTIAVHNPSKAVVEVRGRHNAEPRMSGKSPNKETAG